MSYSYVQEVAVLRVSIQCRPKEACDLTAKEPIFRSRVVVDDAALYPVSLLGPIGQDRSAWCKNTAATSSYPGSHVSLAVGGDWSDGGGRCPRKALPYVSSSPSFRPSFLESLFSKNSLTRPSCRKSLLSPARACKNLWFSSLIPRIFSSKLEEYCPAFVA